MKSKGNVFVGLSGGVDSAVSAALLQQAGYEVTGVFIKITVPGYPCTAPEDRLDAMRVAAHLRIPFLELDLSSEYKKQVFDTAIEAFKQGNTPNPDTLCNKEIKFGAFYEYVREKGADFVATGHYAQIIQNKKTGACELYAGADTEKDQSYFLWMMPKDTLPHVLFPVGGMQKLHVRALAEKFALPNARRKDSQGLCFLGDVPIKEMLVREIEPIPGDVLSEAGEILGTHKGAPLYTLGERRGFTLTAQTPNMPPQYVVAKDVWKNTLTISSSPYPQGVEKTSLALSSLNWLVDEAMLERAGKSELWARFRYRQTLLPASLSLKPGGAEAEIILGAPRYAAPGQSLVVYVKDKTGELCLGGGIISDTLFL